MPFELYPIQLPQTPSGRTRTPLLLLFDGSGFAFEYNTLLPLDRLVYGVYVSGQVPSLFHKREGGGDTLQKEYEEWLVKEFGSIDDYVEQLVRLVEEQVLNEEDVKDTFAGGRPPALYIGGFSFGGLLAIDLARRLVQHPIHHPVGSQTPVKLLVRSVILLDAHDPTSPEIRAGYRMLIDTGRVGRYSTVLGGHSPTSPQGAFMTAHVLHCMKLGLRWDLQPFRPTTEEASFPPVHYLGAQPSDLSSDIVAAHRMGYWTEGLLPTLDSGTTKIIDDCDHFDIWKPGKVEAVTTWLRGVLGDI